MKKSIIAITLIAGLVAGILGGCGNASAENNAESASGENEAEVKHAIIAVGNGYNPFCYLNEDGEPDGYEVQVLKACNEILTDWDIELEPLDWSNVLVSLDTGKVDAAAHLWQINEERAEKYAYTEEQYYNYVVRLIVAKDNDSINSIEDLAGQKVYAINGEASTQALEAYNEANPDKALDLQYSNLTTEQISAAIDSGSLAAYYGIQMTLNEMNANYGDKLKFVGDPILDQSAVILINKENTELKEALDSAIKQLREDGTLTELSNQYLGADYSGAEE